MILNLLLEDTLNSREMLNCFCIMILSCYSCSHQSQWLSISVKLLPKDSSISRVPPLRLHSSIACSQRSTHGHASTRAFQPTGEQDPPLQVEKKAVIKVRASLVRALASKGLGFGLFSRRTHRSGKSIRIRGLARIAAGHCHLAAHSLALSEFATCSNCFAGRKK
ncbi:hypothetical protein NPIL_146961 [Nephila pilipes]|uniref:Uncharacterized protein n=1 Tax=Nephila pilipes TaxID=299642 RepID=A0A8X6QWH4_NEPPI|nr:hypothetical protein NPIL_146961 [Nephila pilipes]